MNITWLTLDIQGLEGDGNSYSFEYVRDKHTHKLDLYFPGFIVTTKIRIE